MILKYIALGVVLLLSAVTAKPENDEEGKWKENYTENYTIRSKL